MLMENIDWQKSGDAIDEAESAEIYEQNMMQRGKAAREIAGKLRFGPMLTEARLPANFPYVTTREDYLGRNYSEEVMTNPDIASDTKKTYADIIFENPELRAVKVVSTPGSMGGSFEFWKQSEEEDASEEDKRPHMEVSGDFDDDNMNDKISEASYYASTITAIQLAIEVGCDSSDILMNPSLQRDILLLHEMGHAKRFINEYINPLTRRVRKEIAAAENRDGLDQFEDPAFALGMTASANDYTRRTEVMYGLKSLSPGSLMTPGDAVKEGLCVAGEEDAYKENAYRRLEMRFRTAGVGSLTGVVIEDARRYRLFDEEHLADEFALDYVRRHLDRYFLKPGEEPDGSGRVARKGGEMNVTNMFGVAFNCVSGNEVILKSLRDGAVSGGRFMEMPHKGGDLRLSSSDDPEDWEAVKNYGEVQDVSCKTIVDDNGKAHRQTIVRTNDGEFLMSTPAEVHRPIIRSPEELKAMMNIGKGDELQMMSLLAGRRDSDYIDDEGKYEAVMGSGCIIYGRVTEDIEVGQPLTLSVYGQEQVLTEWQSWPVESIEQDWHTWRINTKVGEKRASYEIIPLPE